ncbi:MAG: SURF1 family protein [Acidiferrobacteraceae bacterium]
MCRGARPGIVPTIAALVACVLFVRLGFWQLHRADQARAQKQAYDARVKEAPLAAGPRLWNMARVQFRRVTLSGRYDARHQILLDNQFSGDRVGYDVLTPLRLAHSRLGVLVNRGWIPYNGDRSHPPEVPPPSGMQQVTGLAVVPGKYFRLGRPRPLRPWHVIWEYLDLKRYARSIPYPLQPAVVLLAPRVPGGYVRNWPRVGTGVAMHEGYALQWFLFAASVLVIYAVVNRPKRNDGR